MLKDLKLTPFLSDAVSLPRKAALFLSGQGSNAEAVLNDLAESPADYTVSVLVTDAPEKSRARELAARFGLPLIEHDLKKFYAAHGAVSTSLATAEGRRLRELWTEELRSKLADYDVDFGILAGFTTQVANAAGPVMAIYLVLMKFSKEEYIGSAAWYFLILNWIKLPLFAMDGRLNWQVIRFVPGVFIFLILGSVIGILFLRNISQKSFTRIVQILTAVCAVRLLWMSIAKLLA